MGYVSPMALAFGQGVYVEVHMSVTVSARWRWDAVVVLIVEHVSAGT